MKTEFNNLEKKCIYIVFLLFATFPTFTVGQTPNPQDLLPALFPLAPNHAALGRHDEIRVNHFTGVPDISMPLYTVKSGDIEIPIVLRYNASGVRVNDVASWVGLGWSLEIGPSITRQIMDRPDDGLVGYFEGYLKPANYQFDPCINDEPYFPQAVDGNGYDTEPDMYTYNIPGKSGKFFFDGQNNLKIRKIPYSPVYIQPYLQDSSILNTLCFNIIDDVGNYYAFGKSGTSVESVSGFPAGYGVGNTAWKIDTLISQNKRDSVFFTYFTQQITVQNKYSLVTITEDFNNYYSGCNIASSNVQEIWGIASSPTTESLPETISFKNGKIVFNESDTHRSDLDNAYSLKNIQVFDLDNSTVMRTIQFHYGYFVSNRLKLDSISILDNTGTVVERYRFEYNTTVNLPERNTHGVDLWGYYNGKSTNTSYFPEINTSYVDHGASTPYTIGSNNSRDVDTVKVQANVLKKLYYPTGGYSEFEYEANRLSNSPLTLVGGLRIKIIKSYTEGGATPIVKTYEYSSGKRNFDDREFIFMTTQVGHQWEPSCGDKYMSRRVYSAGPDLRVTPHGAAVVFYPKVKEYVGNGTDNTGKTEYTFTDASDGFSMLLMNDYKQSRIFDYSFKRGQLKSKSVFSREANGVYKPITREFYEYGAFPDSTYNSTGFVASQYYIYYVWQIDCNSVYEHSFYDIPTGDGYLTQKIEKIYDGNDTLKFSLTTTSYSYDNFNHQHVSQVVTTNSKGETVTTRNRYVADYTAGHTVLDAMVSGNMHALPIEQYTEINANTISGQLNWYRAGSIGTTIVPDRIKLLEIEDPISDFTPSYVSSGAFTNDSRYTDYVKFDSYNGSNNLIEYTPRNSPAVSALWGYEDTRVVAKVVNANKDDVAYSSFEADGYGNWTSVNGTIHEDNTSPTGQRCLELTSLQKTGLTASAVYHLSYSYKAGASISVTGVTSTNIQTFPGLNGWTLVTRKITGGTTLTISGSGRIDEVRLCPASAQMTTYTHEPLIGMTSSTDTNGLTTYYQYDDFGRLELIKDAKGNILRNYSYHYKD